MSMDDFRCRKCLIPKPLIEFSKSKGNTSGYTHICKLCDSRQRKENYRKNRARDLGRVKARYCAKRAELRQYGRSWRASLEGRVSQWWANINHRTINGANPRWENEKHRFYLNAGIRLEITRDEFAAFVAARWPEIQELVSNGATPSVDRIDSSGHYSVSNLRIISLAANCRRSGLAHSDNLKR